MPGPYAICTWVGAIGNDTADVNLASNNHNFRHGPFGNGNKRYVVFGRARGPGKANQVCVYASGDSGATWAEADAANAPGMAYPAGRQYGAVAAFMEGAVIYILHQDPADTSFRIASFNTDTDTYGSLISNGPVVVINSGRMQRLGVVKRPDGSFVIGTNRDGLGGLEMGQYAIYDPGTGWTGMIDLNGLSWILFDEFMSPDGTVYFYSHDASGGDETDHRIVYLTPDDVLHNNSGVSITIANDGPLGGNENCQGNPAWFDNQWWIPYPKGVLYSAPVGGSATYAHLGMICGETSEAVPSPVPDDNWTTHEVSFYNNPPSHWDNSVNLNACVLRGKLHAVWASPDAHLRTIYTNSRTAGGSWQTGPNQIVFTLNGDADAPPRVFLADYILAAARVSASAIGMFFDIREDPPEAPATMWYFEFEPSGAGCRDYVY